MTNNNKVIETHKTIHAREEPQETIQEQTRHAIQERTRQTIIENNEDDYMSSIACRVPSNKYTYFLHSHGK